MYVFHYLIWVCLVSHLFGFWSHIWCFQSHKLWGILLSTTPNWIYKPEWCGCMHASVGAKEAIWGTGSKWFLFVWRHISDIPQISTFENNLLPATFTEEDVFKQYLKWNIIKFWSQTCFQLSCINNFGILLKITLLLCFYSCNKENCRYKN
jgi:hypothetical protein